MSEEDLASDEDDVSIGTAMDLYETLVSGKGLRVLAIMRVILLYGNYEPTN